MFSLKVVDTDMFLDMSPSAQNLYFHLGMRADDDGFVSSPKKIMAITNASEDDMRVLVAKNFVIPMATNGVSVITHWHTNNLIRPDRYQETGYKDEKARLGVNNGMYIQGFGIPNVIPNVIPNGNQMATQVRLGKVRLGNETNISAKCSERPTRTYLPVDDDGGLAKQPAKQTAPPLAKLLIEVLKKEQGLKHLDGGNNIRAATDVARKFKDECDTRFQSHNETDEYYADQFGVMLHAVFSKDSYFKANSTSMRFINNNLIKMINSVL